MPIAFIVAGLVLLAIGGEAVVRGASKLAAAARIAPVVIGLTVVAFGTSAPEMAVAVGAALRNEPDLVIGNIVGSNIYNVLVVLGLSALVVPLIVHRKLVRWDVPVMIAASVLLFVFGSDGELSRVEGLVLVGSLAAYLTFSVIEARRERDDDVDTDEFVRHFGSEGVTLGIVVRNVTWLIGGVVLLVIGANLLVDGAVEIAETLGFDRLVIGLTVVALGTSLPELATSIVAAFRGERDLAVGNIVGSNIMNILAVGGLTAVVTPDAVPVAAAAIRFDMPVMIVVAVACLPIFFTGHVIMRWEGFVFVGYAVAYTAYLVLDAVGHGAVTPLSFVMLLFVIPLTLVTLVVVTGRALRRGEPHA
jgi:cation:H+ antiporter